MIRKMLIGMIKHVGVFAFGGAVLWQVAGHAVPHEGCEAIVHVTEVGVEVSIDGRPYRIETWRDSPFVCELRPGRHALRMSRCGHVLYEEAFSLRPGEEIVLTARDEARSKKVRPPRPVPRDRPIIGVNRSDIRPALLDHDTDSSPKSLP